jgi:hypothetical protein
MQTVDLINVHKRDAFRDKGVRAVFKRFTSSIWREFIKKWKRLTHLYRMIRDLTILSGLWESEQIYMKKGGTNIRTDWLWDITNNQWKDKENRICETGRINTLTYAAYISLRTHFALIHLTVLSKHQKTTPSCGLSGRTHVAGPCTLERRQNGLEMLYKEKWN